MSMKNSSGTIENRTHDLLTCSAVPQPTAPPLAPIRSLSVTILNSCLLKSNFKKRTFDKHILNGFFTFSTKQAHQN